jgi:hypothetical protein
VSNAAQIVRLSAVDANKTTNIPKGVFSSNPITATESSSKLSHARAS